MKTHCCFCGQQCGIQLKVRDNQVIGFEPWEEFPFNRGMLCPKGVKRYLQGDHPDRLLDPLMRRDGGFRDGDVGRGARFHRAAAPRDPGEVRQGRGRGLRRRVADHREGVPARQVRARGAGHAAHRLQRPPLHGLGGHGLQAGASASTARPIPWSDIPKAEVLFVIGANIAECAPITTDYIWRCRDNGGKLIVADPRMTPITRNADLYLPRAAGHRPRAADGHAARDPARRPRGPATSSTRTPPASRRWRNRSQAWTRARAAESTGVPPEAIEKAAHWIGEAERAMMHARARHGAPVERASRTAWR